MAVLSVEHVTKRYGTKVAVDDVSFEAHPGRVLGLLGPNGAGKTSTLRMVTYITVPDTGAVRFDGRPVGPWSQAQMGYLPEERGLYKKLSVEAQLIYLAELKGVPRAEAKRRVQQWLERFDAADWGSKKVHALSKGMQQKVQFIATVLHEPRLLIFDEPFSGLDPINAEVLRSVVLDLKAEGRTIVFASHRMEQVEQMCDDICLMNQGEIVLQGRLRDVKQQFGRDTVILEYDGDASFLDDLEATGQVRVLAHSLHRAEVRLLGDTPSRLVLDRALEHVDDLYRFELVVPPLNDIFVSVVGGHQLKDAEPVAVG